MKRGLYIVSVVLVVLLIGLTSAGLWSDFKSFITGKATQQPTDVSVMLTGVNPVNISVDNSTLVGGVTPLANTIATSYVTVEVCDPDGVSDINSSSVEIEVSDGTTTRVGTCNFIQRTNPLCETHNCSIITGYFDPNTAWTINASATDLGNKTRIYNDTQTYMVNLLRALVIDPTQINWSATPGDDNVSAENHPTTINNTGNYNGVISIKGHDLYGVANVTEVFGVSNFTTDYQGNGCSGVTLFNATSVNVTGSNSNPGNLSLGGGAGQADFFYCIPSVPLLPTDEYITVTNMSWNIMYE